MSARIQALPSTLPITTPEGVFLACYSASGLCRLTFPSRARQASARDNPGMSSAQVRRWHALTKRALARALAGQPLSQLPPLDLSSGTDFQRLVWRALCRIGLGQTRSYAQVAQSIGRPGAVRAVGGACGANPIPVFVPCHRVLAAGQRLGGFSAGLEWKTLLLEREGGLLELRP